MSDTGIHSTLYQLIREQADFLDQTLINIKTYQSIDDDTRDKLVSLLAKLASDGDEELSDKITILLLRSEEKIDPSEVEKCKEAIQQNDFSEDHIVILEKIAIFFEKHQLDAIEKMDRRIR